MIRLYLMGMKGFVALRELNKKFIGEIEHVTIGRDANVQNDYSKEIRETCKIHNLPNSYKGKSATMETCKTTASFAIGWRWLINTSSLLIVFHDSLLPKHRGFNPLVTALINRDPKIGVTALKATSDFDAGPICGQLSTEVNYPIKIQVAIEKISLLYAQLLNQTIAKHLGNCLEFTPQNEEQATYSLWRDEEDYRIDWRKSSEEIAHFIKALGFPYKGASMKLDQKILRVFDATSEPDIKIENRQPGKVIFKKNGALFVVCGYGLLKIQNLFHEDEPFDFSKKFRLRFK